MNAGPYAGWIPSSDWFFNDKYGVLYDSGPHLFDLMMNILSDRIVEVSARGISTMHGINVFDNIAGFFMTEKGTLGSFNIGWRMGANYDSIQVHGTGGSVLGSPLEVEVRHGSFGPLERIADHIGMAKKTMGILVGKKRDGKLPNETFFREDRAFIDAIYGNSEPLASGENGLRVLEVLDGIKESLNGGSTVKVRIHGL